MSVNSLNSLLGKSQTKEGMNMSAQENKALARRLFRQVLQWKPQPMSVTSSTSFSRRERQATFRQQARKDRRRAPWQFSLWWTGADRVRCAQCALDEQAKHQRASTARPAT